MELSLKDKRAFVCGSTQGIGLAAAKELASIGASVVLLARNEEKLRAAVAQLDASKGQKHDYLVADFSSPSSLKEKVETYLKSNSAIHILVNNTGGPPAGLASDAKEEEFITAFNNHLICNHILVKSLMDGMKKEGYGRIINVISTSVKQPLPGLGVSNTIRGAVANWSKTLAGELGRYNITVNNVLPGATGTERLKNIIENKANKVSKPLSEIEHEMLSEIPMKRFAKPEEIAAAIAFLASPAASYINGINLPVDGGRTACL